MSLLAAQQNSAAFQRLAVPARLRKKTLRLVFATETPLVLGPPFEELPALEQDQALGQMRLRVAWIDCQSALAKRHRLVELVLAQQHDGLIADRLRVARIELEHALVMLERFVEAVLFYEYGGQPHVAGHVVPGDLDVTARGGFGLRKLELFFQHEGQVTVRLGKLWTFRDNLAITLG